MIRTYNKPTGQHIGRGESTERLYRLEEKRNKAIKEAATELAQVLGHSVHEFWQSTMPEELLSILDSFDTFAATLAARAYLEKHAEREERFEQGQESKSKLALEIGSGLNTGK